MAYASSELACLGVTGAGDGNHLYFYANTAAETTSDSGFFNDAADQITTGDVLVDVGKQAIYVLNSASGVVTVAKTVTLT